MKIERIRKILRNIPTDDTHPEHLSDVWAQGFEDGIAEALKYLEAEAIADECVFTNEGNCTILGGK